MNLFLEFFRLWEQQYGAEAKHIVEAAKKPVVKKTSKATGKPQTPLPLCFTQNFFLFKEMTNAEFNAFRKSDVKQDIQRSVGCETPSRGRSDASLVGSQ